MKRTPILMKNQNGTLTMKHRIVIGVMGTHKGVGVTHFVIMLAQFLSQALNVKTAIFECNNHNDYKYLQMEYGGMNDKAELIRQFNIYNVTYFKNVKDSEIINLLNENYEYFIMDFGYEYEQNKAEFLRCDKKIIIGNLIEWKRKDFFHLIRKLSHLHNFYDFLFLIVYGKKKEIKEVKSEMRLKMYEIPFEPDPFVLSKDSLKIFHKYI